MNETLANSAGGSHDSKQRSSSENDVRSSTDLSKKSDALSMLSVSEKSLLSGGGPGGAAAAANHHMQLQHLLLPPGATHGGPQTLSAQQMQSLLQGQVLSQQQLQQLVLQQQSFLQQQQLQEQATLLQQMQAAAIAAASGDREGGKTPTKLAPQQLQSLALQQAHMIQLQAQHQAVASGQMMLPPRLQQAMSASELQALWKEVAANGPSEDGKGAPTQHVSGMLPGLHHRHMMNGLLEGAPLHHGFLLTPHGMMFPPHEDGLGPTNHPLYAHGMCKWPGCETVCDDFPAFLKHLSMEHGLDDRSTAQARVQMQVVTQLEIQLTKERERLAAMMAHLHMKPPKESKKDPVKSSPSIPKSVSVVKHPTPTLSMVPPSTPPMPITSHASAPYPIMSMSGLPGLPTPKIPPLIPVSTQAQAHAQAQAQAAAVQSLMSQALSLRSPMHLNAKSSPSSSSHGNLSNQSHKLTSHHVTPGGPIRRRNSEKYGLSLSTAEILHNSDFYKNTDVRPPFTYAALIRQAIIDSPDRQLTLNEIYNWFTRTFAYFRRNAATWKNAVRHNLSLHKCFVRVENVKGAVWTVDEIEFMKRRPQRMGSLNTPPSTPNTPTTPISKSVEMLAMGDMPLNLETHIHAMGGSLPLLSDAAAAAAADHGIEVLGQEDGDRDVYPGGRRGGRYQDDERDSYPGEERERYPGEERERYVLEGEDAETYSSGERGDPFPDDERDSYPHGERIAHPGAGREAYPNREQSPGREEVMRFHGEQGVAYPRGERDGYPGEERDGYPGGERKPYIGEDRERFAQAEEERLRREEEEEERYAREEAEEEEDGDDDAFARGERETYPGGERETYPGGIHGDDIVEVEEGVRNTAISGDELAPDEEGRAVEGVNQNMADLMDPPSQVNRRKVSHLTMDEIKRLMHHNPMMVMMPQPTNGQSEHNDSNGQDVM